MRPALLLVTTLLVTVPLSGCLQGLLGIDEDPPDEAQEPNAWVRLPYPSALPVGGVLGLWIDDDVQRLRLRWVDVDADVMGFDADAWQPDSFRMHPPEGLAIVYAPSGDPIVRGNPETHVALDDNVTSNRLHIEMGILIDLADPEPGLYRIALHGAQPSPAAEVLVDATTPLYPMLPLGVGYQRHLLVDTHSNPTIPTDASGTFDLPPFTVRADADMVGYGTNAETRIVNSTGALLTEYDSSIPQRPGGSDQFNLFSPEQVFGESTFAPAALDGGQARWTARLTGSGYAFLWLGRAPDVPAPAPLPRENDPQAVTDPGTSTQRILLAGAVRSGEGAWFTMPDDARLRPLFDGGDRNSFRIYDHNGTRMVWDTVVDDSTAYPLPAGRYLIVHDGADARTEMQVEVLDAVPADASLHEARTERITTTIKMPETATYFEASASLHAPGPVATMRVERYDDYTPDLALTVSDQSGPVVTLPVPGDDGPLFSPECCGAPLFMDSITPTPYMDGGRYRVDVSGTSAIASFDLHLVTFVLDGGASSEANAGPETPTTPLPPLVP